uniref:Uncharacterized protein n=2 Tax=Aureoumbra lagunensis TaxID=44058 RepID=A0A7S3NN19_9STRA
MNGDEPLIALDPRQAARVKPTGKADDHGPLIGTACESEVVAAPRSQSSETNVSTKLAINVYATNYSDASTLVPTDYDNRYGTSRIDNLRQSVIEDDTFNQVAMNVCATNYSDASTLAQSIIEDDTSNIEIPQVLDTKDYTIMTSGTLSTTNLESCDASMSHVISTISTLSGGVCLDEVSLGTLSTTNLESCDASMSHVISTISTLSGGVCLDEASLDPNEMSILS